MTIVDRNHDIFMSHPTLELLELHLLLGHYHSTIKAADSGEQMWLLNHKMMGMATVLGLHRDPEQWDIPEDERAKRRWIWWNVLTFERLASLLP